MFCHWFFFCLGIKTLLHVIRAVQISTEKINYVYATSIYIYIVVIYIPYTFFPLTVLDLRAGSNPGACDWLKDL